MADKFLKDLPVSSTTTGFKVVAYDVNGKATGIEPLAFAAAPTTGPSLSDANPLSLNTTASPGTANTSSRSDHRHILPTPANIGAAAATHTHAITDVTSLRGELDGKAPATHTHSISQINSLSTALDNKAPLAHTHAIADVLNLQVALNAKQDSSSRGVANGYAPLDSQGLVPLANLPSNLGGGSGTGTSNVNNGTADGQVPVWQVSTGKFVATTMASIQSDRTPTVERNSATVLTFNDYNRRNIVLTNVAPLSLAASEIGTAPVQGMEFVVNNEHTAVNTITFGAGITVKPYPAGTGTANSVKVAANGGLVAVQIFPVGSTLVAKVRGQIA